MVVDSLALPIAEFYTENTTICNQGQIIIQNQSANYTASAWIIEGNLQYIPQPNGDLQVTFFEKGIFDVTLVVANSCGRDTLTREGYITVFDPPSVSISASLVSHHCTQGETYDLFANSPDSIVSYNWYPYGCQGANTNASCRQTFSFAPIGNEVGVIVTDVNGCTGQGYKTIAPPHSQNPIITYDSGLHSVCQGEDFDKSTLGASCYPPECHLSIEDFDTNTTGERYICLKGTYANCTTSSSVSVYVIAKPQIEVIDSVVCVGSLASFNADFGAGGFYQPSFYANNSPIGANPYFTPDSVGLYAITGLDNGFDSNCLSNDTIYIRAIENPVVELQYHEKICRNTSENVIITANLIEGLPPYSYKWEINGSSIETDTNVLVIPISELPNMYHSVFLTVTHNNGCVSEQQRADFTIDLCNNIEENTHHQFLTHQTAPNQLLLQAENMPTGEFHISLYDLAGRKILQQDFFNTHSTLQKTIFLQNTNSGIYILQLQSETGIALQQKIWIE